MKYKAILFDMDGTLVPMDTDTFTRGYFKFLYAKLAKHGLDAGSFGKNMWAGVAAMVKNDGSRTNEDAFWEVFEKLTGVPKDIINADCVDFYGNEFNQAKMFTEKNSLAPEAIRAARNHSDHVVLATNPMFPMVGQETRMGWVGLKPEDFDLVTAYEDEHFCKPNPKYYLSICDRLGVQPSECLMIGNDEEEDMYAASSIGMNCWLVTNWMIPSKLHSWNGSKGTFQETVQMLNTLD